MLNQRTNGKQKRYPSEIPPIQTRVAFWEDKKHQASNYFGNRHQGDRPMP